jgi:serine/threonine-protein kinase RsbW
VYYVDRDSNTDGLVVELGLRPDVRRVRVHSPADLRPLCGKLEDWMRVLGYPRTDIFAVTVALAEVVTNALRHGNRGDPGKHVRVSYVVTPAELLLEVEDQGDGFDPARVPHPLAGGAGRPGGWGLFLARAYATWVSFSPRGNRVTLCKQRSAP